MNDTESRGEAQVGKGGFLRELLSFAWQNKIFWVVPLIFFLVLLLALMFANYSVSPFHYTVM